MDRPNYIRWRCVKRKNNCRGALTTNKDGTNLQMKCPHNHVPDEAQVRKAKHMARIKDLASTSEENPAALYARVLAEMNETDRALMPTVESCRKTLRHHQTQMCLPDPSVLPDMTVAEPWTVITEVYPIQLMDEMKTTVPPPLELRRKISIPHKLLMGPGPANSCKRISDAASLPLLGHLHPEFLQLMFETRAGIQYAFQTRNDYTFAVSGTGHAAMEASLCNVIEPGDKVLLVVNGHWGEKAADVAERCGAIIHKVNVLPGNVATLDLIEKALTSHEPHVLFVCHGDSSSGVVHPLDGLGALCERFNCLLLVDCVASLGGSPIFMDQLGIDILYSGSQKVLNAPPGLSPISFSNRAMAKIRSRRTKVQSYYFDAILLGNYWGCDDQPPKYHHTGPINLVYALREALALLAEETLEACWDRHTNNAKLLHQSIEEMGLKLLVQNPDYRLPTVTTVVVPQDVNDKKVIEYCMKKFFLEVAGGLPPLAGKVWRVGLMGVNSTPQNVSFVVEAIKEAVQATRAARL